MCTCVCVCVCTHMHMWMYVHVCVAGDQTWECPELNALSSISASVSMLINGLTEGINMLRTLADNKDSRTSHSVLMTYISFSGLPAMRRAGCKSR